MRRYRTLAAALIPALLVAWSLRSSPQPVAATQTADPAAAGVTGVILFAHPYVDPAKDGTPDPIACNGGAAPKRVIVEVLTEAATSGHEPVTFEFGSVGTGRKGGDDYSWIQETRTVLIAAGVTSNPLIDQKQGPLPAGRYYFHVKVGDLTDRCEITWSS